MSKIIYLFFITLFFLGSALHGVYEETQGASDKIARAASRSAADRLLVKFKDKKDKKALEKEHNMKELKHFKFIDTYLYEVDSANKKGIRKSLEKRKDIKFAEPDYEMEAAATPADLYFPNLWGLANTWSGHPPDADIDATRAWDITTGSENIVVAVIDTGVDYNHEDLAANMWQNPGETPGDGIDNDGNGYIDDIYGMDACNNDSDPYDDHSHGTHCAGTIGAVGNNITGVVGVCWNVKIMALKFLSAGGSGYTSNAIDCVYYAVNNGAHVMSNSWGGGGYSQALYDAVAAARNQGILFIAAAGNSALDNDVYPHYPSSYNVDNVISVAATDYDDLLAYFSNYGVDSVDVGAPGRSIYSTIPGDGYGYKSGTSMATPHVAGLAALVLSRNPALTWQELKAILLYTSDPLAALNGKVATGGRINAYNSVSNAFSPPPVPVDLQVASYPVGTGVQIDVTPADNNGNQNGNPTFYRRYDGNTVVQLTAPASADGMDFIKWEIEGAGSQSTQTIQITMSTNLKITAVYGNSGLCTAVNNCDLVFQTGGDGGGWLAQTVDYLSGGSAAQTPYLTTGQKSYIQTTFEGPGYLSFYEKFISGGYVYFYIDGTITDIRYSPTGWDRKTYLIGSGSHTVKWEYRQGASTTSCLRIDQVQFSPGITSGGAVVDFNRDGKMDILWRHYGVGNNQVWEMDNRLRLRRKNIAAMRNLKWRIAGTGDFNGDGHVDVLWRHYTKGYNRVWYMNKTTKYSAPLLPSWTNVKWRICGTGDFNGDGKVDILWRNYNSGKNLVWYMNGITRLGKGLLPTVTNTRWRIAGTGDFNGDGKVDILWRNYNSGKNLVWYMNGITKLGTGLLPTVANTRWRICGTGDFNGDGKVDILWRNFNSGKNLVWYMNNRSRLGAAALITVYSPKWRIALSGGD